MGAPTLFAKAARISHAAVGACAALCAELEHGFWTSRDEVRASYPHARWSEGRAIITINNELEAVVAFNFERGIALVDFASLVAKSSLTAADRSRIAL